MDDSFIGRTIGGFRIVRQVGRGGMGFVFEAEELALRNRRVALKILPLAFTADPAAAARFRREAEIVAFLDHPNIVPVYAVGEETGLSYYAMKYVKGCSMADAIEATRRFGLPLLAQTPEEIARRVTVLTPAPVAPTDALAPEVQERFEAAPGGVQADGETDALARQRFKRAAGAVAEAADGLQYAHGKKVIHRDIKPANLMVDQGGNVLIADFGLATDVQSQTLTVAGSMMGTPAYMSPEQVMAAEMPIDHRTDIYSLGATLYEALTLVPPFQASTRDKLLQQILRRDPRPPRALDKRIPTDLDVITMKALEKDLGRRYQSAGELGDDLRQHLAGEPISARPSGPITRTMKRVRRHRVLAGSILAASAIAILSVVLATIYSRRKVRAHRTTAVYSRDNAYWEACQRYADSANPVGRLLVAIKGRDHALENELRSSHPWEGTVGRAFGDCPRLSGVVTPFGGWDDACFSPSGDTLAACSGIGVIKLWDVRTGRERRTITGHGGAVASLDFSPDGSTLASAGQDTSVRVWNAATGEEKAVLRGHGSVVAAVGFSPDGATLASGSRDTTVRLWDAATARGRAVLKGHRSVVWSIAFSPDSATLASASDDGTIRLWDAANGQERGILEGHSRGVRRVVFSPDGTRLASAGTDGAVKLWDVAAGRETAALDGHKRPVPGLAFSPDGAILVSGGADRTIRFWDVAAARQRTVFEPQWAGVRSVSFSPDGATFVSTSATVKLWDVATGRERAALDGSAGEATAVAFAPTGSASPRPAPTARSASGTHRPDA